MSNVSLAQRFHGLLACHGRIRRKDLSQADAVGSVLKEHAHRDARASEDRGPPPRISGSDTMIASLTLPFSL